MQLLLLDKRTQSLVEDYVPTKEMLSELVNFLVFLQILQGFGFYLRLL